MFCLFRDVILALAFLGVSFEFYLFQMYDFVIRLDITFGKREKSTHPFWASISYLMLLTST